MRWTVTGAAGMFGRDLIERLESAGHDVVALGRSDLDISDLSAVTAALAATDVVANCAAYTAVDDAETDESSAFDVNATGAGNLARATRLAGQKLVHISTDYVFAGNGNEPYPEEAPIAPRSAYGRTKAAGEWAVRAEQPDHLIIRTAWLYGASGPCFPKSIARAAGARDSLDVVSDQVGQPTWTVDLADLVVRLVEADAPAGIYHGTASGAASWFEFAQEIVAATGRPREMVRPTTSADFPRPAPRPAYSVLGHERLQHAGVAPIGHWRDRWATAAQQVLDSL